MQENLQALNCMKTHCNSDVVWSKMESEGYG